jgi:DNA-binding CsgD family transcriptional regulator
VPDLPRRLAALRNTARDLQRDRDAVLRRLRRSLDEMQAHRKELIRERHTVQANTSGRNSAVRMNDLALRFGLTPRESEVAFLLADGCSNSLVAELLGISRHTARHHTQHVLGKLAVRSRGKAAAIIRGHVHVTQLETRQSMGSSA